MFLIFFIFFVIFRKKNVFIKFKMVDMMDEIKKLLSYKEKQIENLRIKFNEL